MATEFNKYKLPQRWSLGDYTDMLVSLLPDGFLWVYDRFILGSVVQDLVASQGDDWQDGHGYEEEIQDVVLEGEASGHLLRRLLSCFASEYERFETAAWSLVNQTDPGVAVELLTDWEKQLGLPESCFADMNISIAERQRQAHAKLFTAGATTNKQFFIDLANDLDFEIAVEESPLESDARIMGVAIMGVEPMGGYGGSSIFKITILSGDSDSTLLKCLVNKYKQAHVSVTWEP